MKRPEGMSQEVFEQAGLVWQETTDWEKQTVEKFKSLEKEGVVQRFDGLAGDEERCLNLALDLLTLAAKCHNMKDEEGFEACMEVMRRLSWVRAIARELREEP